MKLSLAFRLARRELRGGLRGFRILLACIILGVAAIAAVGTVREAIATGMAQQGATLLGGDAEIELTYGFATAPVRAWMEQAAEQVSEIVDFRSMAVTPGGKRGLTQLKAVDGAYPLTGTLKLSPDMPLAAALAGGDGLPGAVMHPLLSDKLSLAPGDTFRLGTQSFRLMATLLSEPDNATGGFGLGPRTIVATTALKASGLLAQGSLYHTKYRLDLPPGTNLAALQAQAETALEKNGIRWRDSRNAAPGVARFVSRLGAFLVLVGLSGLAIGGVGISAALRAYLAGKTEVIAILRTLGADRQTIFLTYFIQVGVLALGGIAAGLVLGVGLPVLLAPWITAQLPIPAVFAPYSGPAIEAALYSILAVLIFTLWPLSRTQDVRAATLFRDPGRAPRLLQRWPYLVVMALLLLLLLALAAWFSDNLRLTAWTTCGIAGALALLALAARGIRLFARTLHPRIKGRPALGWALAAIGGPGTTAGPVVLSLGLGLSVLAAVGQIDGNLRGAIARDLPQKAPSYFFVDIQKDQMPAFRHRLETDPGVSRIQSAPMLRGIITQINGRPAKEVAGDHWVVSGDRGVSYADAQPDTTTLTAGTWWGEGYRGTPQLSFAAEEAEEIGLSLGDTITLNILGRDITATLTSLREVDFSTAGMGFVMILNAAAVAAAPHTYIATVYADAAAEAPILRDISDAMPNVTAIRVRDAIEQITGLLKGLASAIAWGASVTLLTGLLVLIGAAASDQSSRIYEAAILKTLGATRRQILLSLALRSALLGLAAGSVALAAGIIGGWAVSHFVMETRFSINWPSALIIVAGGAAVSLLAGLAFAWGPLRARPGKTLRARE